MSQIPYCSEEKFQRGNFGRGHVALVPLPCAPGSSYKTAGGFIILTIISRLEFKSKSIRIEINYPTSKQMSRRCWRMPILWCLFCCCAQHSLSPWT